MSLPNNQPFTPKAVKTKSSPSAAPPGASSTAGNLPVQSQPTNVSIPISTTVVTPTPVTPSTQRLVPTAPAPATGPKTTSVSAYRIPTSTHQAPTVLEGGGSYGAWRRFSCAWFPPSAWFWARRGELYREAMGFALNTSSPHDFRARVQRAADMLIVAGLYGDDYPIESIPSDGAYPHASPNPRHLEWAIDTAHAFEGIFPSLSADQQIQQMQMLHQRLRDEATKDISRWWRLKTIGPVYGILAIVLLPISIPLFILGCMIKASSGGRP